jgi:hypothetical protein
VIAPRRPAPDGGDGDLLRHRGLGRDDRVGPEPIVRTRSSSSCRRRRRSAPLTCVPPVALAAFALARRRGIDPASRSGSPGSQPGLRHRGVEEVVTRIVLVGAGASSSPGTCSATSCLPSCATPRSSSTTSTRTGSDRGAHGAWTASARRVAAIGPSTGGRRSARRLRVNTIRWAAPGRRGSTSRSRRYGLRYTINDTINVGGVLRGSGRSRRARHRPRRRGRLPRCPPPQYTNPMSMLIWAISSGRDPGGRPAIRSTGCRRCGHRRPWKRWRPTRRRGPPRLRPPDQPPRR